jgi:TP901 family phage tail tape measure protein
VAFETLGIRLVVVGLGEAQRNLRAFDTTTNQLRTSMQRLTSQSATLSSRLLTVGDSLITIGRTLTLGLTVPLVAAGTAIAATAINFEDAFAGATKTIDELSTSFDQAAVEIFGFSEGLTQIQREAVLASGLIGELSEAGEGFRQDIINLSTEMPVAATELSRLAQVAGQLGVPFGESGDSILRFTKVAAQLGVATDFSAEQAVTALARLGNIMGVRGEELAQFAEQAGSALVQLGNNLAATEPEIARLSLRIAGAARAVGLTTPEVLGLSGALAAAGVNAELGGSAVSRILLTLSFAANDFGQSQEGAAAATQQLEGRLAALRTTLAAGQSSVAAINSAFSDLDLTGLSGQMGQLADGTLSLDEIMRGVSERSVIQLREEMAEAQGQISLFANAIGISEQALIDLIRTDPAAAFQATISAIARLQEEGRLSNDVLTELELNTIRLKDVMNRLGPNADLIATSIGHANTEWGRQIALQEEAARKFNTLKSQLVILKNTIAAFSIELFSLYSEDIARLVKGVTALVKSFIEWDDATKKIVVSIGLLLAGLGPFLTIFGTLLKVTANNIIGVTALTNAFKGLIKLPYRQLSSIYSSVFDTLDRRFSRIQLGISNRGGLVRAIFGTPARFASSLISTLTSGLRITGGRARSLVSEFVTKWDLPGRVSRAASFAVQGLQSVFSTGLRRATGVLSRLTGPLVNSFTGLFSNVFSRVGPFLSSSVNALVGGIQGGLSQISGFISSTFGGVLTRIGGIFERITSLGSRAFGTITRVASRAVSTISSIGSQIAGLASGVLKIAGAVTGGITTIASFALDAILIPFKVFATFITSTILPLLKTVGETAFSVFGFLGKQILGIATNVVPVFGNFLFSGILGLFTKIPLLVGGLVAVLVGPNLIKAVIKNWDTLLDTLTDTASQFVTDFKNLGIEQAILLLFSGGSSGSGRTQSLYGIARALGATEETARKFGYTMGEIAATIINIIKSVGELTSRMLGLGNAGEDAGNSMSRTADIIIRIAEITRDVLMGFEIGFAGTFDAIVESFSTLRESASVLMDAMGNLFAAIFGDVRRVGEVGEEAFSVLDSGAGRAGKTIGEVFGEIISFIFRATAVAFEFGAAIVNAFAGLVNAYKTGGVKGVLDEIVPLFVSVWQAVVPDLVALVTPAFTAIKAYLLGEGLRTLVSAAGEIARGFSGAFNDLWLGTNGVITDIENTFVLVHRTTGAASRPQTEEQIDQLRQNRPDFDEIYEVTLGEQQITRTGQFGGLRDAFSTAISSVVEFLSSDSTTSAITGAFETIFAVVGAFIRDDVWEPYVKPALQGMVDRIVEFADTTIGPTFAGIGDFIGDQLKIALTAKLVETATSLGPLGIIPGLSESLGNLAGTAVGEAAGATSLRESIRLRLEATTDAATDDATPTAQAGGDAVGTAMAEGVGTGIEDNSYLAVDGMGFLSTETLDFLNQFWGTRSPSTVTYAIGSDIVLGLSDGVAANTSQVIVAFTLLQKQAVAVVVKMKDEIGFVFTTMIFELNSFTNQILNLVLKVTNEINKLDNLTKQLQANQAAVGEIGKTINNTTVSKDTTTTNNTFSPTVYGPQPEATVDNLYARYIMASG